MPLSFCWLGGNEAVRPYYAKFSTGCELESLTIVIDYVDTPLRPVGHKYTDIIYGEGSTTYRLMNNC